MTAEASFKKYPYFLFPQAEALANAGDEREREKLVRRVASYIGDADALRRLTGVTPEEFHLFYPDRAMPELTTDDTITTFIDRFGGRKPETHVAEEGAIPVAPAIDYVTMLDRLEAEADAPMPADGTSAVIDTFLNGTQAVSDSRQPTESRERSNLPGEVENEEPEENQENVRKLVKDGKYAAALDMLLRMQLRSETPLPCVEDQMRFLRKILRARAAKAPTRRK